MIEYKIIENKHLYLKELNKGIMIEYKVIEKKHSDLKELLNDLGKDSWELCGVYEHDFIFKRYKPDYTERYYIGSDNDSD